MKSIILILTTILFVCLPSRNTAQNASINGPANNGASYFSCNAPVPIISGLSIGEPGPFLMNNFDAGKEYKIKIYRAGVGGFQVSNLQTVVGNTVVGDDYPFTWETGNKFGVSYHIPMGTAIGSYESITFEIFKKSLGFWFSQSVFNYAITTTCMDSYNLNSNSGFPLQGIDYEVSNTLSVSLNVTPQGGLAEFDAGQSVTLLPGFLTTITPSIGGAVQVVIEGCGGAMRLANTSSFNESISNTINAEVKVYPNPVQNQLSVIIPNTNSNENVSVRIMDINGKLMFFEKVISERELKIDTERFESGMYFLTITGDEINHTRKIIKN